MRPALRVPALRRALAWLALCALLLEPFASALARASAAREAFAQATLLGAVCASGGMHAPSGPARGEAPEAGCTLCGACACAAGAGAPGFAQGLPASMITSSRYVPTAVLHDAAPGYWPAAPSRAPPRSA